MTVNIQSLNSEGKTWTIVATKRTSEYSNVTLGENFLGEFIVKITPRVVGVYNYRITYDGDSQYAHAY